MIWTRVASAVIVLVCFASSAVSAAESAPDALDYRVELTTASSGFDGQTCWVHARAGAIPAAAPGNPGRATLVVMTMQKLLLTGSDVFYPLHNLWTDDLGGTWTEPQLQPVFERQVMGDEIEMTVCDFWPKWHAASGKLLGTGHTVWYENNRVMPVRKRHTAYAVYDPDSHAWLPWNELQMPDEPRFANAGGGCTQRFDLSNGDILLPIYFKRPEDKVSSTTVVRCRFDGAKLRYVEHGDELSVDVPRGFGEPSLAKFGDRFFLTIRNDVKGYVTSGTGGLRFDPPKPWTFDDGTELGNYNTQQHWVTHSDGLFLVYTRRGADNDHVFRHRAPLFMARVDPDRLCVLRATERVLVPERGARLGNFGVTDVGPAETWVTAAEWMQPQGVEKRGSNNSIWVAKLKWNRPNRAIE
ncbi:MAG: exo-alpha-sialidase [Pirellulaceae bacterium]|nr:exo-alpha-sialidase [Pirellulaceae bacterium]